MFDQIKKLILPKSDKSATEFFKTGDWRTLEPKLRIKNSACCFACPIHNQIRDYFQLLKNGEFEKAWQKLIATNPLPAVLGRVCPKPCETECLRSQFDESLQISAIEQKLGDMALGKSWRPSGFCELIPRLHLRYRIAVIGGGPAGLACAYYLRRMGHWIDIFEAEKELGGLLYYGIPSCRLSKEVLKQEIKNNILSLRGVNVITGTKIDKNFWLDLLGRFDAILIAVGNQRSRLLNIEGEADNPAVVSGLGFLRKANSGEKLGISAGAIVAVVGGGNTAVDAARAAKMGGAGKVIIFYRRREKDMPAFQDEIKAAKEEGVDIIPLVMPTRIQKGCDGTLVIECQTTALGEIDETGRPKPIISRDPLFSIQVHNLIVAIGEETDLSFAEDFKEEGLPRKVFIAGDARLDSARQASNRMTGTVAAAIGSGNRVAQEIDAYLRTGVRESIVGEIEKPVEFSELNLEYFEERFSNLVGCSGHEKSDTESMQEEVERCFSCGFCNSCGNCWIFCPDVSVYRRDDDGRYEINYEFCKGCGICANECPRNVIEMIKPFDSPLLDSEQAAQGKEEKG